MKQGFWSQSSASLKPLQKTKQGYQLENSHASIRFAKQDEDLTIDLSRKSEYNEPTFFQNREQLQAGHEQQTTTANGRYTTDSADKQTSAIRYQESMDTPAKTMYENMQSLKDSVDNQTLFELLPEDQQVQRQILSRLKQAKEQLEQEPESGLALAVNQPQTMASSQEHGDEGSPEDSPENASTTPTGK